MPKPHKILGLGLTLLACFAMFASIHEADPQSSDGVVMEAEENFSAMPHEINNGKSSTGFSTACISVFQTKAAQDSCHESNAGLAREQRRCAQFGLSARDSCMLRVASEHDTRLVMATSGALAGLRDAPSTPMLMEFQTEQSLTSGCHQVWATPAARQQCVESAHQHLQATRAPHTLSARTLDLRLVTTVASTMASSTPAVQLPPQPELPVLGPCKAFDKAKASCQDAFDTARSSLKQQVTAATEVGEVAGAQEAEHVAQASEACRRAAHAAQDACEAQRTQQEQSEKATLQSGFKALRQAIKKKTANAKVVLKQAKQAAQKSAVSVQSKAQRKSAQIMSQALIKASTLHRPPPSKSKAQAKAAGTVEALKAEQDKKAGILNIGMANIQKQTEAVIEQETSRIHEDAIEQVAQYQRDAERVKADSQKDVTNDLQEIVEAWNETAKLKLALQTKHDAAVAAISKQSQQVAEKAAAAVTKGDPDPAKYRKLVRVAEETKKAADMDASKIEEVVMTTMRRRMWRTRWTRLVQTPASPWARRGSKRPLWACLPTAGWI